MLQRHTCINTEPHSTTQKINTWKQPASITLMTTLATVNNRVVFFPQFDEFTRMLWLISILVRDTKYMPMTADKQD